MQAVGSQAKAEIGFALTGGQGSGRAREVGGTLAVVARQAVGKALGLTRHRAMCVAPNPIVLVRQQRRATKERWRRKACRMVALVS